MAFLICEADLRLAESGGAGGLNQEVLRTGLWDWFMKG